MWKLSPLFLFGLFGCAPSAEDIATTIKSENPVSREEGAKIAQNYDDVVIEEVLVSVLNDPSEKVRLNAIESLAEIEAVSAAEALRTRLREDPSPVIRRAAADALGRLLVKEAAPDLIAYIESFEFNDRAQVNGIWALGHLGAEGLEAESKKATLACLVARREQTTDKFIRYNASAALRYLK